MTVRWKSHFIIVSPPAAAAPTFCMLFLQDIFQSLFLSLSLPPSLTSTPQRWCRQCATWSGCVLSVATLCVWLLKAVRKRCRIARSESISHCKLQKCLLDFRFFCWVTAEHLSPWLSLRDRCSHFLLNEFPRYENVLNCICSVLLHITNFSSVNTGHEISNHRMQVIIFCRLQTSDYVV